MGHVWLSLLMLLGFLLLFGGAIVQSQFESAALIGAVSMVVGGLLLAIYMIANVSYEGFRKRRAVTTLKDRQQLDATTFGATFFAESPERANLAARVRDALSGYLKLNLDGLQPDDDLNEILNAETEDPSLLWHMEETFELGQTFNDAEDFEQIYESLGTFRDLLNFVEERIPAK